MFSTSKNSTKVNIIADFLQYWSQTSHNLAIQLDQKYLPEKQLHDAAIQACNKVTIGLLSTSSSRMYSNRTYKK